MDVARQTTRLALDLPEQAARHKGGAHRSGCALPSCLATSTRHCPPNSLLPAGGTCPAPTPEQMGSPPLCDLSTHPTSAHQERHSGLCKPHWGSSGGWGPGSQQVGVLHACGPALTCSGPRFSGACPTCHSCG